MKTRHFFLMPFGERIEVELPCRLAKGDQITPKRFFTKKQFDAARNNMKCETPPLENVEDIQYIQFVSVDKIDGEFWFEYWLDENA
jgi:hypothetical protein